MKASVITGLTIVGTSFLLAAGCARSEAAQSREAPPATESVAKSKFDADSYTVEMKAAGPYKAGKEGKVEVILVPKGSYHVNDKYPHSFTTPDSPPEGMKYTKAKLAKADGTFTNTRGSFSVGFIAAKAGKQKVQGTLKFSVCSDANCVMDKVELDVEVDVK